MAAGGGEAGLSWIAIVRIGFVQACIGALVGLPTTVLNRLMVVEYALLAAIPAGLVAWHYAVQLTRPLWGQISDKGNKRTGWMLGGIIVLASGVLIAARATPIMASSFGTGLALAIFAYTLIGVGVGMGGTSALALLASGVAPARRAAATATTWIMMVAGIVASAITVGSLLDPYSPERLMNVAMGLIAVTIAITALAVFRLEQGPIVFEETKKDAPPPDFRAAIAEIWNENAARRFTIFIFVSMIAFSMQDLILEPFAGLVFEMTPGQSTQLGGQHQGGILLGMIVAGIGGSAFKGRLTSNLRLWVIGGCLLSALGLAALSFSAIIGPGWPIGPNVFALGLGNGVFAVAAIGSMMGLAGAGEKTREGVRMGVWGASQAIAFGLGGLLGALGVDLAREVIGENGRAFQIIFTLEAALFVLAAALAVRATGAHTTIRRKQTSDKAGVFA
jgi:BCD family chlorophyll transporter-like MFS transporter